MREDPSTLTWPCQDSNLGATGYEPAALPLSYRASGRRYQPRRGPPTRPVASVKYAPAQPMLITAADEATGQTIALLITFIGIGVVVNVLILYVVAQVLAEHKENQEHDRGIG